MNNKSPAQYLQAALGILLVIAGLMLAYRAYERAVTTFDQPQKLTGWLELRKIVQPPKKVEEHSLLNFRPELSLLKDDQMETLSGYLTLFLGAFFLLIIAKIATSFLKAGTSLLSEFFKTRKE